MTKTFDDFHPRMEQMNDDDLMTVIEIALDVLRDRQYRIEGSLRMLSSADQSWTLFKAAATGERDE